MMNKAKETARAASRSAKEIHKLSAEIAKLKEVSNWNYQRDQARAEAKKAEPRIKQSKLDNRRARAQIGRRTAPGDPRRWTNGAARARSASW